MSDAFGGPPKSGWAKMVCELHVTDIEASLAFWRDVLGFEIAYQRQDERFVYLERPDGHQVMLCQRNGRFETGALEQPLGQGVMMQIYLASIEPALARLAAMKWPLYLGPRAIWRRVGDAENGQREFFVQDPDGYLIMAAEDIGQRPLSGPLAKLIAETARSQPGTAYRKRPSRFIRRERLGDWRIKIYGIAIADRAPRPELVEASVALAATVLPQPAVAQGRAGIGFVIAHDAATACFGLVYWWQNDNELHQRVYASPLDAPRALAPVADPPAGCIWELAIIDFERRAWIADVLADPQGAEYERYLGRQLSDDV